MKHYVFSHTKLFIKLSALSPTEKLPEEIPEIAVADSHFQHLDHIINA